jgi:hypothetical protein
MYAMGTVMMKWLERTARVLKRLETGFAFGSAGDAASVSRRPER